MCGDDVKEISSDIIKMKKREMEREKENILREEVIKIVDLNKKYCEEIKKLKESNEELKKAVQEREVGIKEVKELLTEKVKKI